MDREVGERFTMVNPDTLESLELQVVEIHSTTCQGCYFWQKCDCKISDEFSYREEIGSCFKTYRNNHKSVIFKLLREQKNSNDIIITVNII
jgi:hypothetical protein